MGTIATREWCIIRQVERWTSELDQLKQIICGFKGNEKCKANDRKKFLEKKIKQWRE